MKTLKKLLPVILLSAFFTSCNKNEEVIDSCKFSAFYYPEVNIRHAYEYNAQGLVVRRTGKINFRGRLIDTQESYIYDKDNKLVATEDIWDGKVNAKHKFTWTNNQLSKAEVDDYNMEAVVQITSIYTFKYNSKGLISEMVVAFPSNEAMNRKHTYEYNENGVETKRTTIRLATGEVTFAVETKPVGFVKFPEYLLTKRGLPYYVSQRHPWRYAMGGVGTTSETFALRNGQLTSMGKITVENIKVNAKGMLTELGNTQFELIDCQ